MTPLRLIAASTRVRSASIPEARRQASRRRRSGGRSARAPSSMSDGTGRPSSWARYSIRVRDRLEQRLEQQVEQQVVAPHVDDERDRGARLGDVGEVLIGPDADVGAAVHVSSAEIRAAPAGTSVRSRSGCRCRNTRQAPRARRSGRQSWKWFARGRSSRQHTATIATASTTPRTRERIIAPHRSRRWPARGAQSRARCRRSRRARGRPRRHPRNLR